MFEIMSESNGNVLGVRAIGTIRKADYNELTPRCEDLIRRHGSMRLLIDMQEFVWEEQAAWGADLHFGREFHNKIERMAIVGNKGWEEWMTLFCRPFYALEARFFHSASEAAAWDWLTQEIEKAA